MVRDSPNGDMYMYVPKRTVSVVFRWISLIVKRVRWVGAWCISENRAEIHECPIANMSKNSARRLEVCGTFKWECPTYRQLPPKDTNHGHLHSIYADQNHLAVPHHRCLLLPHRATSLGRSECGIHLGRIHADSTNIYLAFNALVHASDRFQNHATSMDKPSEATAFIAVILAFLGVADLTAANMNENTALEYWLSNVPVRLTFLFGLTGYVYLFKEDGVFGSGSAATIGIGEPLQNSLVFSFGFFEIAMWFWVGNAPAAVHPILLELTILQIFNSLREEKGAVVRKRLEELKSQEDRL